MSRSNPYKRKPRAARKTILIYAEGQSEEVFLKHLRKTFAKNTGIAITIKTGKGGTAFGIVQSAIKYLGDFDKRIVVIDNDKPKREMDKARNKAKAFKITVCKNTPCLEATLLSILNKKDTFNIKTSAECKKQFEKNYISRKQRSDLYRYERFFKKEILEGRKKSLPELDKMIKIFLK